LIRRICATCSPKSKTAKELLSHQKSSSTLSPNSTIPSDVPLLDQCLRGGFRIGTVTEIVGRSGVGKTQLAMQLCVVAARLNFGSIFVDTEKKLSMERLNEIANQRHRMNMNYKSANNVLNNVTIHRISSTSELLLAISKLDEEIILRNEQSEEEISVASHGELDKYAVKLLIVDSIAAPTRRDFGGGDAPKRVTAIFQIAQQLKYIADQMQVAVVVINQIEKIDDQRRGSEAIAQHGVDRDFLSSKAALGTSWHHCVSTRLALEYSRSPHEDTVPNLSPDPIGDIRTATVMKSNVVGRSSTTFKVAKNGICESRSHVRRQEE
jgi:RAD51-like protein 1